MTEERFANVEDRLGELERRLRELGEEMEIQNRRISRNSEWLRKEGRLLAFALAALIFVCWILRDVKVDTAATVAAVGSLLAALSAFWVALSRGAQKASRDTNSLGPPP